MGMQEENPQRKIRIAYVTSPRELYSEGVGYDERIVPTLEFLHTLTKSHPLFSNVELAAVFVDDDGKEYRKERLESETPTFAYLRDFCRQNNIVFHIENSLPWRSLPKYIVQGGVQVKNPEKKKAKMEYEEKMLLFMRQNQIDIILSDSYAVLFNAMMLDRSRGYFGLIVNIHPGIASEVPGIFPTKDALARAKFFTDDPQERCGIAKQLNSSQNELSIRRNGYDASIKNILSRMGVPFEFKESQVSIARKRNIFRATTGATLHIVDEQIDHGPIIMSSSGTPIKSSDSEQELRVRNYYTKNR
ncbi:MAG: hypothetical protein QW275_02680, partial [Candidatus Anstonellaceae archaeon]